METKIGLLARTEESFARLVLPNGSTIEYKDPFEAEHMLKLFFGFNNDGCQAYFQSERVKSWEHIPYNPKFHHVS